MKDRSRNDRAYDLAGQLGEILEQEHDPHIVLWTLSFVSALTCQMIAEQTGVSPDQVANMFASRFQRHLPAVMPTERTALQRTTTGKKLDKPETTH